VYDNILLAIDDSEQSGRAVQAAAQLAKLSGGTVTVFHVREHQDVIGKSGGSFDIEYQEEADALVQKAAAVLEETGVKSTSKVIHAALGHVAREVVKAASEAGSDTIVMGSHGRSAATAAVLGSNAYKVLHLTDRPVLVIR
jgi:nucleotide-binding universal stress UspA family protein